MDIGFVLVADKKFGLYGKNQRNLSCFSGFRWFLTGNAGYFFSQSAGGPLHCIVAAFFISKSQLHRLFHYFVYIPLIYWTFTKRTSISFFRNQCATITANHMG